MVRDFQYNEEEMKADKEEMNRLSTDKKKQFVSLYKLVIIETWDIKDFLLLHNNLMNLWFLENIAMMTWHSQPATQLICSGVTEFSVAQMLLTALNQVLMIYQVWKWTNMWVK